MYLHDVGYCLRQAQADTGITSADIAIALDVKPQQVARWRKTSNMKFHTMLMICDALEMELDDFLRYDRQMGG